VTALLSPHFSREEFTRSQTAIRQGIPNEPSDEQWKLLEGLAVNVLEPAREALGAIRVTSGYRSPKVNALIGGAAKSDHMILADACAADLVQDDLGRLFKWLYVFAPWSKLIWEFDRWVHVSWSPRKVRPREPLRAVRDDGDTVYRPMGFEEVAAL